jgi:hypothetical protein
VVGFIANELEKVRGVAGPVAGGGEVARAPPQPRAGPERRSDHGRTHGEERRVTGDPFINSKFLFF